MKLRAKLLLPLLLLSALVGGFLHVYWIPKAVAEQEALHIRAVERHLDSVADSLSPLLLARELDTVHDILTELFKRNSDWKAIRLESAEGRLLYPLPGMVRPPFQSADVRDVTRGVGYMGLDLGRLSVAVDMTALRRELQARHGELTMLLLGMLAVVTLTLVLTLELAVRRPVRLLAAASRQLAQGQFGAPLPADAGDEVGALAAGFAAMRDDIRRYQGELLQDIHERTEAEAELRQSNELLETMFSSIHVLVAYMDRDFNFIRANRNYAAAEGQEPEYFVGKNHFALYPNTENEAIFRRVVETGKAEFVLERPFEYAGHPERGRSYWDWALHPVHGPDGQVSGLVLSLLDVTERKLAESTREQLAAIVRSSRDAIIGKDTEGVITSWNLGAQKTYGYSAEEMLGRPVSVLAPPERGDEIRELLERVKRGESVEGYETERVRKDGSRLTVALTLSPIYDETGRLTGISTIARDITELKRAELALKKTNRFLRTLSRCNETLIHATHEAALLDDMCRVVVEEGGFRLAWVGYVEHDRDKSVRPVAQFGERAEEYVSRLDITWADAERGRGPTGSAARDGHIHVTHDTREDPAFGPWRARALEYGFRSSVALPLKVAEEVIGVLNIYAPDAEVFSEEEMQPLAELAADLAFGIATLRTRAAHERSGERLARSMEATIRAIARTIEKRDPYTAGHQQRVAGLAAAIAAEMGLPPDRIEGIRFGGLIHDIGKAYVPSEILNRPGRLQTYEFALIKTHPEVGYDIVKDVELPWPVAQMILQHHERLDGSGYPKGLKDGEIILEAQILAVADVVEAMGSHRPYRAALGVEAALAEIRANRGRLYAPEAVDACLRVFSEKGFALADAA